MNRYSVPLVTAMLATAVLLAGCTAPSGLKALDRQATSDDKMPEGVTFDGSDVRPDSAYLLASRDGVKYFAAKNQDSQQACLAIVPEATPSLWASGCGSLIPGGEVVTAKSTDVSAVLVTDGSDIGRWQSQGWMQVHDNLLTSR